MSDGANYGIDVSARIGGIQKYGREEFLAETDRILSKEHLYKSLVSFCVQILLLHVPKEIESSIFALRTLVGSETLEDDKRFLRAILDHNELGLL